MSGIAGSELILLILIGLIVLGPKRLPQVANQLGSWLGQARRMTRMMKRQLEEEVNLDLDKELGLGPSSTSRPTSNVSSPKYVHEKDADDDSEGTASVAEEAKPAHADDFSPAHEAGAVGTGVGNDADFVDDDELEPVVGAADDQVDAAVEQEAAEPEKKESA